MGLGGANAFDRGKETQILAPSPRDEVSGALATDGGAAIGDNAGLRLFVSFDGNLPAATSGPRRRVTRDRFQPLCMVGAAYFIFRA
jgi:hypothetical protein